MGKSYRRRVCKAKTHVRFGLFNLTLVSVVSCCLGLPTISARALYATICPQEQRFNKAYDESTDILVGKVDPYPRFSTIYSIQVERVYKGHASGHVKVVGGSSDDYILTPGSEYLVYGERADESLPLHVSICGRTRERSSAAADIKRLEEIAKLLPTPRRGEGKRGHP
jgi:hypothetical protein